MASAVGCGGAELEDVEPVTEAPQAEGDVSAQRVPPGCGGFRQPCCSDYICNTGLECDLSRRICLY